MPVRAKFVVQSIKKYSWNPNRAEIELTAVTVSEPGVDGKTSVENQLFGTSTPAGKIELSIENPAAIDRLQLGKFFYVDFIETTQ